MAIAPGVGIKVSANIVEFTKNMRRVTADINALKNTAVGFKNAVIGAFAIDSLASFGKSIFDVTAQFQTFEATLTNTLGSKSAAKQALEEVRKFATETPFAVAEVSAAYTRWANQGLNPTTDKLKKLGDVASALGGGFEQTAEAFKDLAVGQTKRIEELGILATQAGGKIQLSFKGQRIEIEKTAEGVDQALNKFSQLPGVFGATESVSKTLNGKLSNLKDTFDNLLLTIGNSNSGLIAGILDLGINAFTALNNALNNNIEKTQNERNELNYLVSAITNVNVSSETRKKLIQELVRTYPEFLRGLDIEKVTDEQIKSRLDEVNVAYAKKLALMTAESQLMKIREEANDLYEEERKLLLAQAQATEKAKALKGKYTTQVLNSIVVQKKADEDALAALDLIEAALKRNKKAQEEADKEQIQALEFYDKKAEEFAGKAADYFKGNKVDGTPTVDSSKAQQEAEKWLKELMKKLNLDKPTIDIVGQILFDEEKTKVFFEKVKSQLQQNLSIDLGKNLSDIKIPSQKIKVEKPEALFSEQTFKAFEKFGQLADVGYQVNESFKAAAEDGLRAFGQALGQVFSGDLKFGDALLIGIKKFLQTFSKLLIGYAVASDAFKKAFENPYVAIAAGIALSALAGAIGNVSKAGPSGSSGVGGGFERKTTSGFSQNINITGKLVGSGRDLVAVIGSTSYDNKYTKVG